MAIVKIDPKVKKLLGPKTQFVQGNMACVYGALLAGCRFFAGYPITPATEIAEGMAQYLPKIDGVYIQMEDEIASLAAVIGSAWTGTRAMTATSGPGFSLMQENIGYACMTETPCVIVDVQRSGPSTGQPTEPAQGDVLQSRWGTHGDHQIIVLSPSSVQETLELTIRAFNLSDKYRVPVILLTDGYVAHMREKIVLPDTIEKIQRAEVVIDKDRCTLREVGVTRPKKVPPIEHFGGKSKSTYLTGLTHEASGLPVTTDCEVHKHLVMRLHEKIKENVDDIIEVDARYTEDADVAVVSFGVSARPSLSAVLSARKEGIKAGYVNVKTLFPRPKKQLLELSKQAERIIVPEMNLGQYFFAMKSLVGGNCEVECIPKIGGEIHTPYEILECIRGVSSR